MTKRHSLRYAKDYLMMATRELEAIKDLAIKSRKRAKVSAKPKWTKSIRTINRALTASKLARQYARLIPKRV